MSQFKTIAAYISGGICGPIWWPAGALCGKPLCVNLRGPWGCMDKGDTFRDVLLSLLCKEGGDFQAASFTADTRITIERRRIDGPGKYTVHSKDIELIELASCADMIDADARTGDFMGDCE